MVADPVNHEQPDSGATVGPQEAEPFLRFANPVLGFIVGILIVLPMVIGEGAVAPKILIIPGAGMGALLGFRQRNNRLFLYVCLLAIAVLGSLIKGSISALP